MSKDLLRHQRGMTFIEVMGVVLVASAMALLASRVFLSTNEIVDSSRKQMRARADNREGLEAIADILRAVDPGTLAGFDATGRAVAPEFQRVKGASREEVIRGPVEKLVWRADTKKADVHGFEGEVYLVTATEERRIATRVPEGHFVVVQEGLNLVVRMSTRYEADDGRIESVSASTAIALRN